MTLTLLSISPHCSYVVSFRTLPLDYTTKKKKVLCFEEKSIFVIVFFFFECTASWKAKGLPGTLQRKLGHWNVEAEWFLQKMWWAAAIPWLRGRQKAKSTSRWASRRTTPASGKIQRESRTESSDSPGKTRWFQGPACKDCEEEFGSVHLCPLQHHPQTTTLKMGKLEVGVPYTHEDTSQSVHFFYFAENLLNVQISLLCTLKIKVLKR